MPHLADLTAALGQCKAGAALYPADPMWPILVNQLSYMVDLEMGRRFDREGLRSINVGTVAARLMAVQGDALASLLADIESYAEQQVLDDNPLR